MKRKGMVRGLFLLCIVILMSGCEKKRETKRIELKILAAASMTDVMEEIAERYEKENEAVELMFSFDSSGTLKTQIEQGAPADVFLSAAVKQMDELQKAGFMEDASIVNILENKVVLIKPTDSELDLNFFADVAKEQVKMAAIGNADVPVGQYTEEIYRNLGLWDTVYQKANLAANVRQVLDWVASGNADCGIVYATDARMEPAVTVVCEAPEGTCKNVVYPAGVVKASRHKKEANAFLDYLRTDDAKKLFETYGFTIYEE